MLEAARTHILFLVSWPRRNYLVQGESMSTGSCYHVNACALFLFPLTSYDFRNTSFYLIYSSIISPFITEYKFKLRRWWTGILRTLSLDKLHRMLSRLQSFRSVTIDQSGHILFLRGENVYVLNFIWLFHYILDHDTDALEVLRWWGYI